MGRGNRKLNLLSIACAAFLWIGCGPTGGFDENGDCDSADFVCGSGECVPRAQVCNGRSNCEDGSDEDNCVVKCERRSDYRCKDGDTCIGALEVCDGREQCPGGDDEATCGTTTCDGFQCKDGTCISAEQKCDDSPDCSEGEDEAAAACSPQRCGDEELRCDGGRRCVAPEQICDGTPHCSDLADESDTLCGGEGGGKPTGDGGRPGGGDNGNGKGGGDGKPDPQRACTSIDEQGLCDGDNLVWCDNGQIERRNCRRTGQVCGRDAEQGFNCIDTADTPPAPNNCGGVTDAGSCNGDVLTFCSRGRVREMDCSQRDRVCRTEGGESRCVAEVDVGEPDACKGLTAAGVCDGDTHKFCDSNGEPQQYDCAASEMVCGDNGDGTMGCQAAACGDIDFIGTCDGDTLKYCQGGSRLVEVECGDFGFTCGLQDETVGNVCQPAAGGDACGTVTYEGECTGDQLSFCQDGQLYQYDCSITDRSCGEDTDSGLFLCQADSDGCGDVTLEGKCEGTTAMWCSDGAILSVDCADENKTCGYISDTVGYYCTSDGGNPTGGSCTGMCGVEGPIPGSSPTCYCDAACELTGDCCDDYAAVCDEEPPPPPPAGPSCEDHCGEFTPAPGSEGDSCYCDDFCEQNGDCCEDKVDFCGTTI